MIKLLAITSAFALLTAPACASDVVIKVTGVKAKGGTIRISLYDEATFLKPGAPYNAQATVDAAGDLEVTIKDVKPGDYAVAALHDADDSRGLTMGPDGRMAEGTALSNAERLRSAPTFAVNKVVIADPRSTVEIAMSYPEDRPGGW